MTGHVVGLPLEETMLQLAPAGVATATACLLAMRARLDRLRARLSGARDDARGSRVDGDS
jgi:hypothetical protein